MKSLVLYVVIPCYNEESCLKETTQRLKKKFSKLEKEKKISSKSRIVYVDDGSKDKTWELIESFKGPVVGIKLAHNRGHQTALLAGLMYAKDYADVTISMDADLQDDINTIDKFIDKYNKGYEIIYGVRSSREKDSFFKKNTAQGFYKMMNKMGVELVYNSADCRLMSKRALEELSQYREANLFLRGIIPTIGLKSTIVEYERLERFAGESKYPLKKMLNLAWDGITSFSIKPIQLIIFLGSLFLIVGLLCLVGFIIASLLGQNIEGFIYIICTIGIFSGIQMISIGLVGEYVGKIYNEVKQRPRYIIEKVVGE